MSKSAKYKTNGGSKDKSVGTLASLIKLNIVMHKHTMLRFILPWIRYTIFQCFAKTIIITEFVKHCSYTCEATLS